MATGFSGPIKSKAFAVPAHQGIRFEDPQCLQATEPQAVEPDPEHVDTSENGVACVVLGSPSPAVGGALEFRGAGGRGSGIVRAGWTGGEGR